MKAYEVYPDTGVITTGSVDRMPDSPMQRWYEERPRNLPLEPWMFAYFPSKMTLDPHQGRPSDVVMLRYWGVSQPIKDLIETFEPALHQFIPFTIEWGPTSSRKLEQYYTVKINSAFLCVNVVKSDVKYTMGIEYENDDLSKPRPKKYWSRKSGVPLVLFRDRIAGHHLWIGDERQTYISGELRDALVAGNYRGWVFGNTIVD